MRNEKSMCSYEPMTSLGSQKRGGIAHTAEGSGGKKAGWSMLHFL